MKDTVSSASRPKTKLVGGGGLKLRRISYDGRPKGSRWVITRDGKTIRPSPRRPVRKIYLVEGRKGTVRLMMSLHRQACLQLGVDAT